MKPKPLLCLALALSGGLLGCSNPARSPQKSEQWNGSPVLPLITNANQWPGFQILPPITNANPSILQPISVRVPTKLAVERTADTLSVEIDRSSFESTNLMVGSNMLMGVESEFYIYTQGESRPANGGYSLGGDFNLGKYVWHTKENGIPLPGRKYIVERGLTIFETDIPPQHMWHPQGSENYKVLWKRTLKQIVE
jgi:hypothetical protein